MRIADRNLFLLLILIGLAPPATAEEPQRYPIQPVGIVDIGGGIFITGDFSKEESLLSSSAAETTEEEAFFTEGVKLTTDGYFYHPKFFDWNANFNLGFDQQQIDINNESFNSTGTIGGYNLSALILKDKALSLQIQLKEI